MALWFIATESRYRCEKPSPKFQVDTPGIPRLVIVSTSWKLSDRNSPYVIGSMFWL